MNVANIGVVTTYKNYTQLLSLSCRRTGANTENNNYYITIIEES